MKATHLPPFVGNTIRGALGYALREVQDEAGGADIVGKAYYAGGIYGAGGAGSASGAGGADSPGRADAVAQRHMVYDNVFKVSSEISMPNPYAISAPYPSKINYAKGEELVFGITLFGRGCEYAPEVLAALGRICKGKLENAACHVISLVYDDEWSDRGAGSIAHCDRLTVKFVTPTEILSSKEPVAGLSFSAFIDNLFGRISGLIDNYTDSLFTIPYSYIAAKPLVRAEYDLQSVDLQTSGQPIKSFVGTIKYFGDVTRYLPYIDLGSQLHIGKKTTRACGEYYYYISNSLT